ncbi:MAG: hypothetical protein ACRCV6_08830 [Formosimonas sp.]
MNEKVKRFLQNYGLLVFGVLFIGMMWRDHLNDPVDLTRMGTKGYGHNGAFEFQTTAFAVVVELLVAYAVLRPWSYQQSWGRALSALIMLVPWLMLNLVLLMHAGGIAALHVMWLLSLSGVVLMALLVSVCSKFFR